MTVPGGSVGSGLQESARLFDGIDILGDLGIGASLIGIFYLVTATIAVWSFGRRRVTHPVRHPSVTIMKPVCGADPGLYENLRSFWRLA